MNLPEFYIEKNNFYKKDDIVYELIYQNDQFSITLKHPITFTEEENTQLDTRIIDTDYFRTYYPKISETFPSANYKQKKLVITHALNSLKALAGE
jgi:hypothetical protein